MLAPGLSYGVGGKPLTCKPQVRLTGEKAKSVSNIPKHQTIMPGERRILTLADSNSC